MGRPRKEPGETTLQVTTPVAMATLREAVTFGGQTELTINKTKIPKLKDIYWDDEGFLIIETDRRYRIPSSMVKSTVLAD
jgi:hypothetical protein